MAQARVLFVELPVFSGMLPLASGYMEAMCRADPEVGDRCEYEKLSLAVTTPFDEVVARIQERAADVYAFSCYVWNSGMVRRLVSALEAARPDVPVILGGPQVMHHAALYLDAARANRVLCNGEGERTLANFVKTILRGDRDWSSVAGLSYYAGSELRTNPAEPRITDLSEIPSPFLEGLFDGQSYSWMLIETNRGCPFKCNYCYWGAATGAKVFRYDEGRLHREFDYISRSGAPIAFIVDANWGMLKRDVELSRHLADCFVRHGAPKSVYFCASKNTPERVAEITRIFNQAGMVSARSVALQTMNEETLRRVNRENIRSSAYIQLQQSLNEQDVSSFIELIWPLPGETLSSFQKGIAHLSVMGADSFCVYPLLLVNNVDLASKRDEYGLVTIADSDPNSEAEVVIGTREISDVDYADGVRFTYAVTALHGLRAARALMKHCDATGKMPCLDLLRGFVEYARRRPDHPWVLTCERLIASRDGLSSKSIGELVHHTLHENRAEFDDLLSAFVVSHGLDGDLTSRVVFEFDLLNRPYVYRNTPIALDSRLLHVLDVTKRSADGCVVEAPSDVTAALVDTAGLTASPVTTYQVRYRRSQQPLDRSRPIDEHFLYCQEIATRARDMVPTWTALAEAPVAMAVTA